MIGFGSGMSAGVASLYDKVERIDIVELLPEVIKASPFFKEYNYDILKNPKTHLYIEDAKTFLQISPRKYDVIISEPTNPWVAGVAGLFTVEHFDMMKGKLNPGGIVVQWLQAYEFEDENILMVFETFRSVFPCFTLWSSHCHDLIILGGLEPLKPDWDLVIKRINSPKIQKDLADIGIERLPNLLFTQIASFDFRNWEYNPITLLNSDFYPYLEFNAPRGFFINIRPAILDWIDQRPFPPNLNQLFIASWGYSLNERKYVVPNLPSDNLTTDSLVRFYNLSRMGGGIWGDLPRVVGWFSYAYFPEDKNILSIFQKESLDQITAVFNYNNDPIVNQIARYHSIASQYSFLGGPPLPDDVKMEIEKGPQNFLASRLKKEDYLFKNVDLGKLSAFYMGVDYAVEFFRNALSIEFDEPLNGSQVSAKNEALILLLQCAIKLKDQALLSEARKYMDKLNVTIEEKYVLESWVSRDNF